MNLSFPSIILLIPALFLSEFNYLFNLGCYLVFALPSIMLLCRIKTFSEDSILPETRLGYDPFQSWLLSLLSLSPGLVIGLSGLYLGDTPFHVSLIRTSLALISSMITMFPDYINKLLSYEIRSEKGRWTLIIINVVAITMQGVVFVFMR